MLVIKIQVKEDIIKFYQQRVFDFSNTLIKNKSMSKKLIITFTLLLFITISCKKQDNEYETIKLKPKNEQVKMSRFIKTVEYIKLKTPKGLPIGDISNVIIHNDMLFVCHSSYNPLISVFDKNGIFKYNIGKIGRGPGEYSTIHSLTINDKTEEIVINDLIIQKAHFYNINGTHIKSIDLPIHALELAYINNNEYTFWVGGLYNEGLNVNESKLSNLYIADDQLNIKQSFLKIDKEFKGVTNGSLPSSLSLYKNGVNIVSPLSYYVYNYTDGKFSTKYYMDFGSLESNFKYELRQLDEMQKGAFFFKFRDTGATYYINQFFEFDNYMFFTFLSNNKMYSVVYDKKHKVPYVTLNYPIDDINGAIFGKTVGRDGNNKLITTIEPMLLTNEDEKFPEKLDYLNLSSNSNPIIAIYKIK